MTDKDENEQPINKPIDVDAILDPLDAAQASGAIHRFGPVSPAAALLQALQANASGFLHLFLLPVVGLPHQKWLPLPISIDRLEHELGWCRRQNLRGWNTFAGVNPCTREEYSNAATEYVVAAFVDVDKSAVLHAEEKLHRLAEVGCPASATVWTGHGFHYYYFLTAPARYGNLPGDLNRTLKRYFDCDAAVDRARLARLAGTVNHKIIGDPVFSQLLELRHDFRLTPGDIASALRRLGVPLVPLQLDERTGHATPSQAPARGCAPPRPASHLPPPRLPATLWDRERNYALTADFKAAGKPSRSEADLMLACALVRSGWSDEMIWAVFEGYPAGGRYHDLKSRGPAYLARTISKARHDEYERNPPEKCSAKVLACTKSAPGGKSAYYDILVELLDGPAPGKIARERVMLDGSDSVRADGLNRCIADLLVKSGRDPATARVNWDVVRKAVVGVTIFTQYDAGGTWDHIFAFEPAGAAPGPGNVDGRPHRQEE